MTKLDQVIWRVMMIKDYRKIKKENEASSPFKCYFIILYFFFLFLSTDSLLWIFLFLFLFLKFRIKIFYLKCPSSSLWMVQTGRSRKHTQGQEAQQGGGTGWYNTRSSARTIAKFCNLDRSTPWQHRLCMNQLKKKYLHKKNSGHPVGQQASSAL